DTAPSLPKRPAAGSLGGGSARDPIPSAHREAPMWLLLACHTSSDPQPVARPSASAARVREPHLAVTDVVTGGAVWLKVAFAAAARRVRLYAGAAPGGGPCYGFLQGGCLGLTKPVEVADLVAGSDGLAQIRKTTPGGMTVGSSHVFQAIVDGNPP